MKLRKFNRSLNVCAILAVAAAGCASGPKAPPSQKESQTIQIPGPNPITAGNGAEVVGPPVPYGPMPTAPREVYGPEPIQLRPAVLVLGPGWARGFAHAGVLQAFHEAGIPIAGVVATEIGSLMAVLYGTSHSVNDFEWSMLKLKPELFSRDGKLLSRLFSGPSDGHDLEEALEQSLGAKELSSAQFPIKLLMHSNLSKDGTLLIDSGNAATSVRASIAVPGLMTPGKWQDQSTVSAGAARPFPISEAKLIAPFPVIVIDVSDRTGAEGEKLARNPEAAAYFKTVAAESKKLGSEADLVIRPNLKGFDSLDFNRRTEIIFRGKKSVLEQLDQIKHLVGMP